MSLNNIYNTRHSGAQHGDVFTKHEVVCFMLDEVGYTANMNLSGITIMEPSCGEGEFVVEIVRRLKLSSKLFGFDLNQAYHKCVSASDIDKRKTEICIQRISEEAPEIEHPEQRIHTEDYLLSEHSYYDIIVGNPPYIRYEEIPQDKLPLYKLFSTFYYRSDMYILFFEKSLSQLKQNGKHCFICANRWMKNMYGKKLRALISQCYNIEKIINVEEADAFEQQVLAYPAITVISHANGTNQKYVQYADIKDITQIKAVKYESLNVPHDEDWSNIFNTQGQGLSEIEVQGFKIGIGIATGADSIFISKNLVNLVENSLLLPVINGQDLSNDTMKWGGRYLLNPYDKDGKLISLTKYPKAKQYLEQNQERLSSRHKAKKDPERWYATIDPIQPTLLKEEKILLPDISGNKYVFIDKGQYYPTHNIYYITGNDSRSLRILSAFLMSDFVRSQLSSLTNHMNGGYARWQSQYLRKLRIPTICHIPYYLADKLLKCYETRDIGGINCYTERILHHEKSNTPTKVTWDTTKPIQLTFSF